MVAINIMPEVILKRSSKAEKKYDAVIDGKKTVSFGQKNASDFTKHKNVERKERYLDRHRKNENWRDYKTAGFWSKWILWNKPTIRGSIDDVNRRFKNINVKIS